MRATRQMIRNSISSKAERNTKAWLKFIRTEELRGEIYGKRIAIESLCSENRTSSLTEQDVFELTYGLKLDQWNCSYCGKYHPLVLILCYKNGESFHTLYFGKKWFTENICAKIDQSDVDSGADIYKNFQTFAYLYFGNMKRCVEKLKLNVNVSESLPENWQEIVIKREYDILPDSTIASILNIPVKKIKELRKNARPE